MKFTFTCSALIFTMQFLSIDTSISWAQPPAETTTAAATTWNTLASQAAALESEGRHRDSLAIANRALELGRDNKNDFQIGRSLILVALSLRGLGYYDSAIDLLQQAIALGKHGNEITIVPVWGYALQELGAIYLQKGDLKKAQQTIEETFRYAEQQGISVGIAEGGAHLAEIALRKGTRADAARYAEAALRAAEACGCSSLNTARAMTVMAAVKLALLEERPELAEDALTAIKSAISYSEQHQIRHYVAEGKMLLSRALPTKEINEKIALATEAFAELDLNEDELRGLAEANIGSVLGDGTHLAAAESYLRNGRNVSRGLLRDLDDAFISNELAVINELQSNDRETATNLRVAVQKAEQASAWPLMLESADKLSTLYFRTRFFQLSLRYTKLALAAAKRLRPALLENSVESKRIDAQELQLRQRLGELGLFFSAREVAS